jgi:hypothetical protein
MAMDASGIQNSSITMEDIRVRADGVVWFLCHPGHRPIMPKLRAFIDHVIGLLTE